MNTCNGSGIDRSHREFFSFPEIARRRTVAICQWIIPEIFLLGISANKPDLVRTLVKKGDFF
jgi:hypothetical protein